MSMIVLRRCLPLVAPLILALAIPASAQIQVGDITPPGQITTLTAVPVDSSSVSLAWTAVGDDKFVGTATTYEVRYRTTGPIVTTADFTTSTQAGGAPAPQIAGSPESMTVGGLTASTAYFFAVRAVDEVGNVGAVSNSPSATTTGDTTPPATVANLATGSPTTSSISLSWTTPGDDGGTGQATTYDLRYSTAGPITSAAAFTAATPVSPMPTPGAGGSAASYVVLNLAQGTTYYFALKAADEVPNWSGISNSPAGTTSGPPDSTPPADVTDLAVTGATENSLSLQWTAPGDDGMVGVATLYDLRYSALPILTPQDFSSATPVTGVAAPTTGLQYATLRDLAPMTRYYVALKTVDNASNWSGLSNSPAGWTLVALGSAASTSPCASAAASPMAWGMLVPLLVFAAGARRTR